MSRHWTVRGTTRGTRVETAAVVSLLQDLADATPARAAVRFLEAIARVEHLSIVRFCAGAAPRQVEGAATSRAVEDKTRRCFAAWRQRFHRRDDASAIAVDLGRGDPEEPRIDVLHYRREDIPDPEWREAIYDRERLAGRVGLMFSVEAGSVFALNCYRDLALGDFDPAEIALLRDAAPLLRTALGPHLADRRAAAPGRIAVLERRLAARAPALAPRERAVAARIACGIGTDGIAADLGVAPSTVLTWRKRLYAKLGIHDRIALAWLLR